MQNRKQWSKSDSNQSSKASIMKNNFALCQFVSLYFFPFEVSTINLIVNNWAAQTDITPNYYLKFI